MKTKKKWLLLIMLLPLATGCRTFNIEKTEIIDGRPVVVFKAAYSVAGDQNIQDFNLELPNKGRISFDQKAEGAGIDNAFDTLNGFIKLIAEGKLKTP